jgi:hypothetical protein
MPTVIRFIDSAQRATPPVERSLDPDDPLVPGWDAFRAARRRFFDDLSSRTGAGAAAPSEVDDETEGGQLR